MEKKEKDGDSVLKILIAEDDQELRALFSHVLQKNGYAVKGVTHGAEALEELERLKAAGICFPTTAEGLLAALK